jgi:hypothetical protein
MCDPCFKIRKLVNELPASEKTKQYWKIKLCEKAVKDLKMINTILKL